VRVRLAAIVGAIGVAGCVSLLAAVARPQPSRAALAAAPRAAASTDVEHVFLRDCAVCHGADGRGTDLGPDLRGAGTAGIDYQLSTGRMPLSSPGAESSRSTAKYSPATIRALVAYVHGLVGGGPAIPNVDAATGSLQTGGSIYRLNCAACHAWSGDGGALLNRAAPSVHPATEVQIAEAIRTGPGNMPAFGTAAITRDQLDSVIRYVRHLDHPDDRGGLALGHLGPLAEGAVAILLALGVLVVAVRWIGTRT
jgi:ubiquinol-cytochrome c reductase cytochrome c subunit